MVEKIGITLTNLTLKSIEKIKQSVIFAIDRNAEF
jgi:hypothetical protein